MTRRLRVALARFEGHWIGDLIGVLALFLLPVGVMLAGLVFGGVQ